jgi:hypothetical protein
VAGAELITPASRTDPALVETGRRARGRHPRGGRQLDQLATPDEIAGSIDLPASVMTLSRSMVAAVKLAYGIREIAADHPGLAAPAR